MTNKNNCKKITTALKILCQFLCRLTANVSDELFLFLENVKIYINPIENNP